MWSNKCLVFSALSFSSQNILNCWWLTNGFVTLAYYQFWYYATFHLEFNMIPNCFEILTESCLHYWKLKDKMFWSVQFPKEVDCLSLFLCFCIETHFPLKASLLSIFIILSFSTWGSNHILFDGEEMVSLHSKG